MKYLQLILILAISALSACGGSDDSGDILADTQLKDLDTTQPIIICEDLVAMAPASCFEAPDNYWKLSAKDSGAPSVEVQYCLANLMEYNTELTVSEIKSCYENADQDCTIDTDICAKAEPNNSYSQHYTDQILYNCPDDLIQSCMTEKYHCSTWQDKRVCLVYCCVSYG